MQYCYTSKNVPKEREYLLLSNLLCVTGKIRVPFWGNKNRGLLSKVATGRRRNGREWSNQKIVRHYYNPISLPRSLSVSFTKSHLFLSYEFFNELYHRFLLTPKVNMKCLCLQALAIVYGRCHEEIGPFSDTKYIVGMLERVGITLNCLIQ